jgi:molybdate transport system substrate-binding protein
MKFNVLFTVLLLQIFSVLAVQAQTIHLSVAASMTDAFNKMITDFSAQHTDAEFLPNFASSGSLAKQIEQGAPADVYVSANPKWMKYLVEKELVAPGTDRIFAFNQLVFVGMKKSTELSLDGLTGLERIALGTPQSVPAGQYAKQAMEHAGIYAALEQGKKLVMAKDVRQALIYADRGEVDGAFVYKTDALLAKNAQILFVVPEDYYDRVSYPIALTNEGAKNDLAKAFYAYINSPEAKAILAQYGFEPHP